MYVDAESINIVDTMLKMGYKEDRQGIKRVANMRQPAILHNRLSISEMHFRGSF